MGVSTLSLGGVVGIFRALSLASPASFASEGRLLSSFALPLRGVGWWVEDLSGQSVQGERTLIEL